ncbi:MAG: hypothetical protein R6U40_08760 [Desulfobacterales bacterium]
MRFSEPNKFREFIMTSPQMSAHNLLFIFRIKALKKYPPRYHLPELRTGGAG